VRLIPIHDESSDDLPLLPAAAEIGVRALASALGLTIADDAVVLLRPAGAFGGHPLARLFDGSSAETWLADERAVERALDAISDAELDRLGVTRDSSYERDAARLLRRRLAHLPPEAVREIIALLPRLREIALSYGFEFED